jgi:hypothetical protein
VTPGTTIVRGAKWCRTVAQVRGGADVLAEGAGADVLAEGAGADVLAESASTAGAGPVAASPESCPAPISQAATPTIMPTATTIAQVTWARDGRRGIPKGKQTIPRKKPP